MSWPVAQSRVESARGRYVQRVHAVDLQPPLGRRLANYARQVCEVAPVLHLRTTVIFTRRRCVCGLRAARTVTFGTCAGKYHLHVGQDACLNCDGGKLSSTLAQYLYYAHGICRCSRKWRENF
jgi:hypothetical protein